MSPVSRATRPHAKVSEIWAGYESEPEWLLRGRANPDLAGLALAKSYRIDVLWLLARLEKANALADASVEVRRLPTVVGNLCRICGARWTETKEHPDTEQHMPGCALAEYLESFA